jgi:hypothetical protein
LKTYFWLSLLLLCKNICLKLTKESKHRRLSILFMFLVLVLQDDPLLKHHLYSIYGQFSFKTLTLYHQFLKVTKFSEFGEFLIYLNEMGSELYRGYFLPVAKQTEHHIFMISMLGS